MEIEIVGPKALERSIDLAASLLGRLGCTCKELRSDGVGVARVALDETAPRCLLRAFVGKGCIEVGKACVEKMVDHSRDLVVVEGIVIEFR